MTISTTNLTTATTHLTALFPHLDPDLRRLYVLLALTSGVRTTSADVHAAWAVHRSESGLTHRALVPFDQLDRDVQARDDKYAAAIRDVAAGLVAEVTR